MSKLNDQLIETLAMVDFEYEDMMKAAGWTTLTPGARFSKRFFMRVIRDLLVKIYYEEALVLKEKSDGKIKKASR